MRGDGGLDLLLEAVPHLASDLREALDEVRNDTYDAHAADDSNRSSPGSGAEFSRSDRCRGPLAPLAKECRPLSSTPLLPVSARHFVHWSSRLSQSLGTNTYSTR